MTQREKADLILSIVDRVVTYGVAIAFIAILVRLIAALA